MSQSSLRWKSVIAKRIRILVMEKLEMDDVNRVDISFDVRWCCVCVVGRRRNDVTLGGMAVDGLRRSLR